MTITQPGANQTAAAHNAWQALLARPQNALLATDFDGVLSPIVADPSQAIADPDTIAGLARVASMVGQVVIITGRPVRTAIELGQLDRIPGLERLIVLGQYGIERWDAATGRFDIPPAPPAIAELAAELPSMLAEHGWADADLELKGRAVAIHTRRLAEPERAFAELTGPIAELAARHGLQLEPGRLVLEVRATGSDKGSALRQLVAETNAQTLFYAGDDLGDLPAFKAAIALRDEGLATATIWSASVEQPVLKELADVVVDGPPGMADWLNAAADAIGESTSDHRK